MIGMSVCMTKQELFAWRPLTQGRLEGDESERPSVSLCCIPIILAKVGASSAAECILVPSSHPFGLMHLVAWLGEVAFPRPQLSQQLRLELQQGRNCSCCIGYFPHSHLTEHPLWGRQCGPRCME